MEIVANNHVTCGVVGSVSVECKRSGDLDRLMLLRWMVEMSPWN